MSPMIHEVLPTASVALLHYVLAELEPDEPDQLYGNTGLPAAVDFPVHDVIVSVTPVTAPMFDQALLRCAAARRRDVMLIRHGFHPETIDPVRVDVVLRSVGGPLLLTDLSFFRHRDRSLHLVPDDAGQSVKIGPDGLELGIRPPWDSAWDRAAGLESAAAQIVLACRRRNRGLR